LNEGGERVAASRWVWAEDPLSLDGTRSQNDMPVLPQIGWDGPFAFLTGGRNGLASLTLGDLLGDGGLEPKGLQVLERVDPVGIVAVPDIYVRPEIVLTSPPPPVIPDPCCSTCDSDVVASSDIDLNEQPPAFSQEQIAQAHQLLVEHCERMRDRVAILEVPQRSGGSVRSIAEALEWRRRFDSERGYAALYHPWIKVLDPLLSATGPVRSVPPCGHIAGLYARTDFTLGVHAAPANAELNWAEDLTSQIDDDQQTVMNPEGLNCLRAFPGRGIRVYGARTISSNPDWRYVNVRRLLIMIEEALDESTQWSVFEPHDLSLRQVLSLSITGFLESIWRRGGLVGATPEEAFFVKCDDTNNPPEVVNAGRLIADIGVAPTIPAEFVIFRVGRTVEELEIVEN
jgi:uncharacterized protein